MKDFITGKDIDIQGLLKVLKAGEQALTKNALTMRVWANECHTAGCLIGSFCINNPSDSLQLLPNPYERYECDSDNTQYFVPAHNNRIGHDSYIQPIVWRFRISHQESRYLFAAHLDKRLRSKNAITLTGEAAVQRLRKFLYYKMRKSELLEDYEAARRISNTDIVPTAAKIKQKELTGA